MLRIADRDKEDRIIPFLQAHRSSSCHGSRRPVARSRRSARRRRRSSRAGRLRRLARRRADVRRLITLADLAQPYATQSTANPAHGAPRPPSPPPKAPDGFAVDLFADGLEAPRVIRTAQTATIGPSDEARRPRFTGTPLTAHLTAFARSASASTTSGFLPPISSDRRANDAWLNRCRRLAKDWENLNFTSPRVPPFRVHPPNAAKVLQSLIIFQVRTLNTLISVGIAARKPW